jgi:hypothetical protein
MDWREYKRLCDRPHTFSRWMVEQSMELVTDDPLLSRLLRSVLSGPSLDKPPDHRGGPATDMFELRLEHAQAVVMYRRVESAALRGQRTAGTRDRGLGGFVAAWRDYVAFLESAVTVLDMSDCVD